MVNTVRVLDADISNELVRAYAPLIRAVGISIRANNRIARKTREALRDALHETIVKAYIDGSAPHRTGRSRSAMLRGVRAFGSRISNVRGYILGPSYIKAHEDGATITPKNAKALAIPLPAAQRPDGSPKLPGPRSWQNVQKTFIYKSKRTGNAYIAYKDGDSMVLLYVLVDQVTLSKHKGFLSASFDLRKPDVMEAFGRAMLFEMSLVNLGAIAGLSPKYSRGRRRGRRR